MIIRDFYIKFKKFNNHSDDKITFWINEHNNCATVYLFRQYYSANTTLYLLKKLNFLGNVQIFFIGV